MELTVTWFVQLTAKTMLVRKTVEDANMVAMETLMDINAPSAMKAGTVQRVMLNVPRTVVQFATNLLDTVLVAGTTLTEIHVIDA